MHPFSSELYISGKVSCFKFVTQVVFFFTQDDRMWQFAVGIFLIELSPGSLRLTAIFGLSAGGATLLLGAIVGNWIDKTPRLRGNNFAFYSVRQLFILILHSCKKKSSCKVNRRSNDCTAKSNLELVGGQKSRRLVYNHNGLITPLSNDAHL